MKSTSRLNCFVFLLYDKHVIGLFDFLRLETETVITSVLNPRCCVLFWGEWFVEYGVSPLNSIVFVYTNYLKITIHISSYRDYLHVLFDSNNKDFICTLNV